MKKTYSTPVVDVKKFDVADIITISVIKDATDAATINSNDATVEIVAKW